MIKCCLGSIWFVLFTWYVTKKDLSDLRHLIANQIKVWCRTGWLEVPLEKPDGGFAWLDNLYYIASDILFWLHLYQGCNTDLEQKRPWRWEIKTVMWLFVPLLICIVLFLQYDIQMCREPSHTLSHWISFNWNSHLQFVVHIYFECQWCLHASTMNYFDLDFVILLFYLY